MPKKVKAIPDGFRTITPHLVVKGASKALDFYKKAFGAVEHFRMECPESKDIMHAQFQIGDSLVLLCEENEEFGSRGPKAIGGTPLSLALYVEDVDAAHAKAVKAGAKSDSAPTDMFWGDRWSMVTDPFGHRWEISTHVRDLTPEQIAEGAKAFSAQAAK